MMHIDQDKLYTTYQKKVCSYVSSRVANRQDAEDLVSSVFLKVYSALESYDPEKAALSTWIYRITHNTVCDYYRANARQGTWVPIEDCPWLEAPPPEEGLFDQSLLEELTAALELLAPRERDVVILRFYKGLPPAQVAKIIGVSYDNAKYIQHTALKKLRRHLGRV